MNIEHFAFTQNNLNKRQTLPINVEMMKNTNKTAVITPSDEQKTTVQPTQQKQVHDKKDKKFLIVVASILGSIFVILCVFLFYELVYKKKLI